MKKLFFMLLATAAVVGCSKSEEGVDMRFQSGNVAQFSSDDVISRVADGAWESLDEIGIFTNGFYGVGGYTSEYSNVKYIATVKPGEKVKFNVETESEQILFPNINSRTVSFMAYYPRVELVSGNIPVTIADQKTDLGKVDFVVAKKDVSYGDGDNPANVEFEFSHKLAKVVFTISCNDDVTDLTGLTADFTNTIIRRTYDRSGEVTSSMAWSDVEIATNVTSKTAATVTAIIHPYDYASVTPTKTKLNFYLNKGAVGERQFSVDFTANIQENTINTFSVALGRDEAVFVAPEDDSIVDWGTGVVNGEIIPEEI